MNEEKTTGLPWSEYLNLRGLCYFVASLAIAGALVAVGVGLPGSIQPFLAMTCILGLLFGPWGALGVGLVNFLRDWFMVDYVSPELSVLDFLATFMLSYIPYKLWYSTLLTKGSKPPILNSSRNVTKFLTIIAVDGLVYVTVYDLLYGIIDNYITVDLQDLAQFLNTIAFALIIGTLLILFCRFFGIPFWTPTSRSGKSLRDRIPSKVYDTCLAISIVLPLSIAITGYERAVFPATFVTYLLLIVFCMKPIRTMSYKEYLSDFKGIKINRFDTNMIDRIMIIFVIYSLLAAALIIITFDEGFLINIPHLEEHLHIGPSMSNGGVEEIVKNVSLLTYLSVALTAFFIPVLVFLRYIEKDVTGPINVISESARDFVAPGEKFTGKDLSDACQPFITRNSEIGDLARSLDKMSTDIDDYLARITTMDMERRQLETEFEIANRIHMAFIPKNFDVFEGTGARVHGIADPAKFVGGDIYYYRLTEDGRIVIAIGDVSGKGIPAALLMAVVKTLYDDMVDLGFGPDMVFSRANNSLAKNNTEMMFVTSWMGLLDPQSGKMDFANAGHCPPLVWRRRERKAHYLDMEKLPVLGVIPDVEYAKEELILEHGDRILIYTDGVTEANSCYDGFYGEDRLKECFERTCEYSPEDQIHALREDIRSFVCDADQFDDITMLVLEMA